MYRTLKRWALFLFVGAALFFLLPPSIGFGFEVPDLPANNLIANPWFRSATDPEDPGYDGWTPDYQEDGFTWGLSQKKDNPTPVMIVSGKCGFSENFCGTALRWANVNDSGVIESHPGIDVYVYQVVSANPANRRLQFFMYWVNHKLEVGEAVIYAGQSSSGPWTEIWRPIIISQDQNPPPGFAPGHGGVPWYETGMMQSTLGTGYPFYKIELHARYPVPNGNQGDVGIKITGVYFSVETTTDPESLSTPHVAHNPTASVPGAPTAKPASTGDPRPPGGTTTEIAPTVEQPSPTSTSVPPTAVAQVQTPLATATERTRPTATPTAVPLPAKSIGLLTGFMVGLLASAAIIVLFVLARKAFQR